MADPRFFQRQGPFRLAELAAISQIELSGSAAADLLIEDVAALETAGPGQLSFLDNKAYIGAFSASRASVCIVAPRYASQAPEGMVLLHCDQPYRAFALVAQAFYPRPRPLAGISPTATVDETAMLGQDCQVAAGAVIAVGAEIGARCVIGANATIGPAVILGDDCIVGAGVSLSHCQIGDRVTLHPGGRIGQDGFGFAIDPNGHVKVPQIGRVLIGDDCDIGANTAIDRGSMRDTVIGPGCWIDNLVQIGHNVHMGKGCVVVAQSGIAGSAELEDFVVLAGQSGVAGHIRIAAGTQIAARSGAMRDTNPGDKLAGNPAIPAREYFRQLALLAKLTRDRNSK